MVVYDKIVYNNTLQTYESTFKDPSGAIVDLTPYLTCILYAKLQGVVYQQFNAVISDPTNGLVIATPIRLSGVGTWDLQFFCYGLSTDFYAGEIFQVSVQPNVVDLGLTQLAAY